MMTVLWAVVALVAGFGAGLALGRRPVAVWRSRCEELGRSLEAARSEARHEAAVVEREREQADRMLAQLRESFKAERECMRADFRQLAAELTRSGSEQLRAGNAEQMQTLMGPLREQMERVARSVQDVRVSSAEQRAAFDKGFEGMMRQAGQLGREAELLARVLRSGGKVQGDWGEQLLESILENSGLRRDQEYTVQENMADAEGNRLRPDVVVHCPGDKKIVIDSKVSLTAYTAYVAAATEDEQRRHERDNLLSVRRHVDELAAKNYAKLFPGALSHVLMFVPNEGSYVLALRADPQLGAYAFRKNVLLINPTNLMMSLQLIYNLWQSERQARNIEEIISRSADLYDKFVGFLDKFNKVEAALQSAQRSFSEARGQLHTGTGNIVRRLERLKELGVTPKKSIPRDMTGE